MPGLGMGREEEILAAAIEQVSGRPAGTIRLEDRIVDDLNLDSLEFVRFVQIIEQMAQLTIPDEPAASAITVGDMIAVMQNARLGTTR